MPQTTQTATGIHLFRTANGKQWRLAGTDTDGVRYFVPAHLDPAKVLRLAWVKETELGPLTPITA